MTTLGDDDLPSDWRGDPVSGSTRAIGDAWVREGKSAVLRVPSVVVPVEPNYVLTPGTRTSPGSRLGRRCRSPSTPG